MAAMEADWWMLLSQAIKSDLFMMNSVTISDDSNETMHTPLSQLSKTYLTLYDLILILN
jgi:hypothetical protein